MKIFEKKRFENGRRRIYFCGIRIFTYKISKSGIAYEYFQKFLSIKNPTKYIRSLGVKVGENVRFVIHPHFFSYPDFGSEPFLIEIGNNVLVSFGVTFLTHDGCTHTCKQYCNDHIFKLGRIKIGDNCFIGCKSTILPGVNIGENSIVGACSLVTKDIPSGEVWAGHPAKYICKTIDLAKKFEEQSKLPENIELYEFYKKIRFGEK